MRVSVIGFLWLNCAIAATAAPADERWAFETGAELPLAIELSGDEIFVAQKAGGVLVLREGPDGRPIQVSRVPRAELENLDAMNLHVEGDLLYVALGDHFAAQGSKAGLAVVDVSDRAQPRVLSTWASAEVLDGAGDVAVAGNFAYLGAMSHGLRILDVSDPSNIRLAATMLPDVHYPKPNPNAIAYPHARGLTLADGVLYLANDAGGLRILDLADPKQPREIGRYVNRAMGAKAQAYNNVVVEGTLAYAAIDYCGVEVLDVSNPADIVQVGWWNPWKCDEASNIWLNSGGHTNGIELDARSGRLYVSGGDTDVIVLDISTPAAPRLAERIGDSRDGLGTWDVAVRGRWIYGTYLRTAIPFSGRWAGVKAFGARPSAPVRARRR